MRRPAAALTRRLGVPPAAPASREAATKHRSALLPSLTPAIPVLALFGCSMFCQDLASANGPRDAPLHGAIVTKVVRANGPPQPDPWPDPRRDFVAGDMLLAGFIGYPWVFTG